MYGSKLKYLIKNKGMTQRDISRELIVPEPTMSFWLNAEYPPLEAIEKICNFFNISLSEFFLDNKTLEKSLGVSIECIELAKSIDQLPLKKKNGIIQLMHYALDFAELFGND